MMLAAGSLRTPVVIERPAGAGDDWGQPTAPQWVKVAAVRADIRHLSGLEAAKADAVASVARVSIRVRFRKDVDATMRVRRGPAVYEIKAVMPDLQRREFVDLVCEVRT